MIETREILQTMHMIQQENFDIRTITLGINLLDCADRDADKCAERVYEKICRTAKDLVRTGEEIETELGIPIVNKRIEAHRPGPGPGGRRGRRQFSRGILRPDAQRRHACRRAPAGLHSGSTERNKTPVLQRERCFHPGGHQHERREGNGRDHQEDGGTDRGPGRPGMREAGCVRQRGGGQSLHGRLFLRRGRAGMRDQCGRVRPGGRQGRAGACQRRALRNARSTSAYPGRAW